jgi:hypothetical protein
MSAIGWRKRQISDQQSEVDERILIEEEIAMIEAMIISTSADVNSQMGVDLNASLLIARDKLRNLK